MGDLGAAPGRKTSTEEELQRLEYHVSAVDQRSALLVALGSNAREEVGRAWHMGGGMGIASLRRQIWMRFRAITLVRIILNRFVQNVPLRIST